VTKLMLGPNPMRIIAVLLLLFRLPILAHADETGSRANPAPFGLRWGMSAADAKASGVKLSDFGEKKTFGISYGATDLPKVLPDTELVALSFGFQDQLWRIMATARTLRTIRTVAELKLVTMNLWQLSPRSTAMGNHTSSRTPSYGRKQTSF
jgi:hypothetical protein